MSHIHVYPTFGPAHDLTPTCWCQPQPDTEQAAVIVHNANEDERSAA